MSENKKDETYPESLMSFWMKSATDFWGSTYRMWPGGSEPFQSKDFESKFRKSWQLTPEMWQSFVSTLSAPESVNALLKGMSILPEVILQTLQSGWGGYSDLQKEWMEKASRIGKRMEPGKFEDIDKALFKVWSEIYEKEFKQFLNVP
ncbi:MAG: hypothetical protein U9N37_03760, partial [Thermodesulfobacteriota bacterium]|nr:hypothetical protein [Thermodesulfobacteriota bacterium]